MDAYGDAPQNRRCCLLTPRDVVSLLQDYYKGVETSLEALENARAAIERVVDDLKRRNVPEKQEILTSDAYDEAAWQTLRHLACISGDVQLISFSEEGEPSPLGILSPFRPVWTRATGMIEGNLVAHVFAAFTVWNLQTIIKDWCKEIGQLVPRCSLHADPMFTLTFYCHRGSQIDATKSVGLLHELLVHEHIEGITRHLFSIMTAGNHCEVTCKVLELGAGDGRLSHYLRRYMSASHHGNSKNLNLVVTATDLHPNKSFAGEEVEAGDYEQALTRHANADIVICSWMPPFDDWTAAIRRVPTVREYILIGNPDSCGHPWRTWGRPEAANKHDDELIADMSRRYLSPLAGHEGDVSAAENQAVGHGRIFVERNRKRFGDAVIANTAAVVDGKPLTPVEKDGWDMEELTHLSDLQLATLAWYGNLSGGSRTFRFWRK